jgi:hypothetical protein
MEQLTSRMEKYEAKQNENRTRSRSRSRSEKFENCWYHHKFGEKSQQVRQTMCVLKKRTGGTEVSAASVPQTISRRLFATDQNTNTQFLIDTGADVSVVPAKFKDNSARNLAGFDLQSADGSAIKVFGQRTLSLNLGLRRPFLWTFIVASVTDAIIGADFLDNFELTVDIKNRKLCDPRTSLSIQCRTKKLKRHRYSRHFR